MIRVVVVSIPCSLLASFSLSLCNLRSFKSSSANTQHKALDRHTQAHMDELRAGRVDSHTASTLIGHSSFVDISNILFTLDNFEDKLDNFKNKNEQL